MTRSPGVSADASGVYVAGYTYGSATSFNTAGANLLYEINVPKDRFANAERACARLEPATRAELADWCLKTLQPEAYKPFG